MAKTGTTTVAGRSVRVGSPRALAAALGVAFPLAGWSQAAPQPQPAPASQQLERVEITGSSIKRIDAETALPVQVITREAIQKSGAATVEQLMQTVTSTTSSGGFVAAQSAGATTGSLSGLSIHGLTSLRTLVLINGRRVSPYGVGFTDDSASVDVNSIPLAAIERIEVLQDGASAIYGSDAIAGVVNFILRREFKGVELTGEYGDTTRGGANLKRGSATVGFGDIEKDRYNVLLVASLQKEGGLYGRDRRFASSAFDVGHQQDTTSGNTFPANIAAVDGSFGTRNPTRPTGCRLPFATDQDPLSSPAGCRYDPAPDVSLVPPTERASLFVSGRWNVAAGLEAYAEASYNQNKTRVVFQPVPLSDQFALPNANPLFNVAPYNGVSTIILKPSSAFYPTAYVTGITGGATPDLLVRYRAAESGGRDFTDIATSPRFVLGAKGDAAGWDFDASFLYTGNKVVEQINGGYPINSKILPLLNSGTVNFFAPNTPAIVSQIQAANFTGDAFTVKTSITGVGAKISRDLTRLPAGPLSVAIGGEYRRETYDFSASTELQQGDISGYGGNFLPVNKSRGVSAVFSELAIPIVKGLDADAAIRFDQYQSVGRSVTPKLGLRWQPVNAVLVRGSIGRGFRAPSLADLYTGQTQSVSPTGLSDPLRCPTTADAIKDCNTQFTTTSSGNAALKPERSDNATLGLVLQPLSNVSLGIDYFKVRLKDTIVNGLNSDVILSDPVKYAQFIVRGPVDPNFPTLPGPITNLLETNVNLGGTKLSGVELSGNWKIPSARYGRFTLDGKATYFTQYDTQNPDGTYSGNVDLPNGSTGGVIPRFKTYVTVDWAYGPWDVFLAQSYQKHYHDTPGNIDLAINGDAATPRDVASYITWDTQASYTGFKNWRLTLGARNVLDKAPPYVNTNAAFQTGYDPSYGDPRGRFVYGRVTYAF